MLSLDDLSQHVADYQQGRESFDDFVDWFRESARGYHRNRQFGAAISAIEAALSKHYFQSMDERELRMELANAIRPFVMRRVYADPIEVFVGTPRFRPISASSAYQWKVAV